MTTATESTGKKCKSYSKVEWKIRNLALMYGKSIHESDNSREEVLEYGGTCFQTYVKFCLSGEGRRENDESAGNF